MYRQSSSVLLARKSFVLSGAPQRRWLMFLYTCFTNLIMAEVMKFSLAHFLEATVYLLLLMISE